MTYDIIERNYINRIETYIKESKEVMQERKQIQNIIDKLYKFKGDYLGDGINPNVSAKEIAILLEELILLKK